MRTTVDIDQDLLKRLRDVARERGDSFRDFLNRVIRRGIDAPDPPTESYSLPVFSMGTPHRSLDKALTLAAALEDEEIARELALRK